MFYWLLAMLKQQVGYNKVDGRDRLELELHALHNRAARETDQKVADNRAHIRAWEARGGREAWEAWVTQAREAVNAKAKQEAV